MDPQIEIAPTALVGWAGRPILMDTAHQHDDLEINFVAEGGSMLYLFGGEPVEIGPGSVAAFWAAVPHQLVANAATRAHWVHVPFATFLGWGLPTALVGRLLSGMPLIAPPSAAMESDTASFTRWAADLDSAQPERRRILLLEVEARVRRLALDAPQEPDRQYTGGDPALRHAVAMVRHIARHFREPLTVADVAGAARLHPNYAMTHFRRIVRTTIWEYLTRCRLAEGRRLLITTDLPIADVAAESGFSSVSRFYSAFKRECGLPPAAYRRLHR
ncbi:helix-turn-helix domain-containing protein [Glycomyces albidus]|uniref:Helix-turn-helix domain-containing protein n=1 Tax=Glycomyces albidus TaxID=2656774 RepID=A0A6L5G7E6_9ACTN|nr:helix-turn-helix domain-containing protein [Glycomyces albidus]MQM25567.1 helix-turn-helix domain-containing protein [Glycomyces albidus]